jgi:WD40 repeat protein
MFCARNMMILALSWLLPVLLLAAQPPEKKGPPGPPIDSLPDGAMMRIGSARLRHLGGINQLQFIESGDLGTVGDDQVYSLWEVKTGAEKRRIPLAEEPLPSDQVGRAGQLLFGKGGMLEVLRVGAVPNGVLSPDGKILVASMPGMVRLLDARTGAVLTRLAFKDGKGGLPALAHDGKKLARFLYTDENQTELTVLEVPGGKLLHKLRLAQGEQINLLALSRDGKYLAGAGGSYVNLWELTTGKRVRRYDTVEAATAISFSPRDHKLVSATNQGVYFWDLASEEETGKFPLEEISSSALAFSPDGTTLATSGKDNTILLWDVAKGVQKAQLIGQASHVSALTFSADATRLAAGTVDGTVHLWDLVALREITPLKHAPIVRPVAFLNSKTLLVKAGSEGVLQHLDLSTGKVVKNLFLPPVERTRGGGVVAPNGKLLAFLDPDYAVQLWDTEKNKELHTVKIQASQLDFSPDGSYLTTLGNDQHVRLWSTKTGKEIQSFETMGKAVERVFFGNARFARSDGGHHVTVSADNRFVVVVNSDGSTATLWELETGKERGRFSAGKAPLAQVLLSSDGRRMATVSTDDVVRVWDLLRGHILHGFVCGEGDIRTVAFSASSPHMAVGTSTGVVILYDLVQGKENRRFFGHRAAVNKVLFVPGAAALISAGEDGMLITWDVHAPPPAPPVVLEPSPARLAELWQDLAHGDPSRAYKAAGELASHPVPAVKLLRERMKPAAAVSTERVQKLVDQLRVSRFADRDQATRELIQFDTQAVPALEKALKETISAEVTRRIASILEKVDQQKTTPENLRQARAVELLERLGTAEAQALLEALAGGAAHARLTEAAQGSLRRCGRTP